jgi:hypothetical protein
VALATEVIELEVDGKPRTYREVLAEVQAYLDRKVKAGNAHFVHIEYVAPAFGFRYGPEGEANLDEPVPTEFWRMVAFPVRGGSEGWYIHVGFMSDRPPQVDTMSADSKCYQEFFMVKTFGGIDAAWGITRYLAKLFDLI